MAAVSVVIVVLPLIVFALSLRDAGPADLTSTYSFSFIASYLGLGTLNLQAKAQAVRY
mgnify:CR=1 FL=1